MSLTKKNIACFAIVVALIAAATPVYAAYTPLVRLPGLPASGNINLSMYLVGLYNFLVSIVGIVAVMMMIVGGMRYITAGGSQTAISDAKDMISSAISGLVIAIFAWVIVSAINPDVLYIKSGGGLSAIPYYPNGTFTAPGTCVCADGFNLVGTTSAVECDMQCHITGHGSLQSISCVNGGLDNARDPKFLLKVPNDGKCFCADGTKVAPVMASFAPPPAPATCEMVCNDDPAVAPQYATDNVNHCGWDFLYVKLGVRAEALLETGNNDWGNKQLFTPYKEKSSSLFDFFLSNNGTLGDADIASNITNYGAYECAIITTNVDELGVDETTVYWVMEGAAISSKGLSIHWDLTMETIGTFPHTHDYDDCAWWVGPAPLPYGVCMGNPLVVECRIDFFAERDCDNQFMTWGIPFYAKYSEAYTDKCGNCTFAEAGADGHIYKPAFDIMCEDGKWRRQ